MTDKTPPQEFLLISRGQWDKNLSPEEIQKAIDAFYVWLEEHVKAGRMKHGQRLAKASKIVLRNMITDGPFTETKEVIGGYWFIYARSIEEAAKFASDSPCLPCGLFYEIRAVDNERANAFTVMAETPPERISRT